MKTEDENNTERLEEEPSEQAKGEGRRLIGRLRFYRKININLVRIFFTVWISVSLVAALPNLRPTVSLAEKRELHKFPEFSFAALFSGDYFDEIGLWYSDTFPCRDDFVGINAAMRGTFGESDIEIHGDMVDSDIIPQEDNKGESEKPEENTEKGTEEKAEKNNESEKKNESDTPSEKDKDSSDSKDVLIEKIGATAIIKNAGYEYYNFNRKNTDSYISVLNSAAKKLDGKAAIFSTVIPTSTAITLDDAIAARISSSDQKKAIDYIYKKISKSIVCTDTYDILREHRDEYLYFRTDHHWTADGAYYSYCNLMKAAGKTAAPLSSFKKYEFKGFLGTFYATSKMSPALGNTPDTIYAYEPKDVKYIHTYEKGFEKDYHIVSNGDKLDESEKYLTFICGDHPLGVITNKKIEDKSSCVIIKESFGNAIVPYFAQNYNKVYVVDYRKIKSVYKGKLKKFTEKYDIDDVFFINNISATRNAALIKLLSEFVG